MCQNGLNMCKNFRFEAIFNNSYLSTAAEPHRFFLCLGCLILLVIFVRLKILTEGIEVFSLLF